MDANRTFIHNTVKINNVTVINNTVINNAPHVDTVRQHVGDRLQTGRTEELWGRRSEQVTQRASQDRVAAPPVISSPVGSSDRPQRPTNTVAPSPRNDQATTPRVIAPEPRREQVNRPSEAVRPAQTERQRPETVVTSRPQTRPEPRVMPNNNAQPVVREQRPSWSSARQESQAQPQREFRPSPQTSERQNSFSGAREQRPAPSGNTWESRGNDSRDSDRRGGQTSDDSTRGRFVSRIRMVMTERL